MIISANGMPERWLHPQTAKIQGIIDWQIHNFKAKGAFLFGSCLSEVNFVNDHLSRIAVKKPGRRCKCGLSIGRKIEAQI
jgi:hypothetical protein